MMSRPVLNRPRHLFVSPSSHSKPSSATLHVRVLPLFLALAFLPAIVVGQDRPDPAATARLHFGPLAATPTIGLSNLGVDTNVFNQVADPKRDFTATVSPQVQFWIRLGKGRLSGNTRLDYVYFNHYATERAMNTHNEVRVEFPLNRLIPYVTESFVGARERPGYEIDTRSRRKENTLTLGTDVRVRTKTSIGFAAWRFNVSFNASDSFAGSYLSEVLNRTADGFRVSVRHKLTPLTTLVLDGEAQRDRFASPSVRNRNANSVRVMPGISLDRFALISGSARVGYRKYDTLGPGAPGFRGLVAATDLGYTLLGVTRFSIHTERDLAYSFDVSSPYYVQTGVTGTVTQRVSSQWDVQGTAGHFRLDYRHIGGVVAGRQDNLFTVGAGAGYRLGPTTRVGVNVDNYRRRSDRNAREYDGLRVGMSVTYGP